MRRTEKGKENVIMQLNFDVNDAVLQTEHLFERREWDGMGRVAVQHGGGGGKKLFVTQRQKSFAHEFQISIHMCAVWMDPGRW